MRSDGPLRTGANQLFCCLALILVGAAPCAAELLLSGNFMQGGLIHGQATPGTRIYLGERELSVTPAGDFIFGFGRDARAEQQLTLIHEERRSERRNLQVEQRVYTVQRISGISKRLLEPTTEDLQRIRREAELVAAARAQLSLLNFFREPFCWPLTGRITGVYGSQRVFNGAPRRPHFGIDIAAPRGTAVFAPAGGRVSLVHPDMFFSGATLILDHGYGLSSSVLHLDKILVAPGERVIQGQQIATVGAGGRATGPHLDWRVNWLEHRLDPALLVPAIQTPCTPVNTASAAKTSNPER